MTNPQEKAPCVSWFIVMNSDIQTQKGIQLNMQKKHANRFAIDIGSLWNQERHYINREVEAKIF